VKIFELSIEWMCWQWFLLQQFGSELMLSIKMKTVKEKFYE